MIDLQLRLNNADKKTAPNNQRMVPGNGFGYRYQLPETGEVPIKNPIYLPGGAWLDGSGAGAVLVCTRPGPALNFRPNMFGSCDVARVSNIGIRNPFGDGICDDNCPAVSECVIENVAFQTEGTPIAIRGYAQGCAVSNIFSRSKGPSPMLLWRGNQNTLRNFSTGGGSSSADFGDKNPEGEYIFDGRDGSCSGNVIEMLHAENVAQPFTSLIIRNGGFNRVRMWSETGRLRPAKNEVQVLCDNAPGTQFDYLALHPDQRLKLVNSPGVVINHLVAYGNGQRISECIESDSKSWVVINSALVTFPEDYAILAAKGIHVTCMSAY